MSANYYEILEIPSDSDEREIKRAYHRLARDLHPDKASNPDEVKLFEERFAQVSAAYNTLKDPEKRADYDRQARTGTGGGASNQRARSNPTAAVLNAGRGIPGNANHSTGSATSPSASTTNSGSAPQAARPMLGLTPEKAQIAQKAFARGMQFFKENQYAKAIDFFEAAIQNNDTEPNYHARLAMSLIHARKSATRAITAAQRAIELDPYNIEFKFTLAYVFEAIGSKTNAQKVYEDIVKWDAGNLRAIAALKELKGKKSGPFGLNLGGGSGGTKQTTPFPGPNGASASSGEKSGSLLNQLFGAFRKK